MSPAFYIGNFSTPNTISLTNFQNAKTIVLFEGCAIPPLLRNAELYYPNVYFLITFPALEPGKRGCVTAHSEVGLSRLVDPLRRKMLHKKLRHISLVTGLNVVFSADGAPSFSNCLLQPCTGLG